MLHSRATETTKTELSQEGRSPLSQSETFVMKCVIICCPTAAYQCAAEGDRSLCLSCRHAKTPRGGGTSPIVEGTNKGRTKRKPTRGGQRGNQQREDHDLPERAQRAAYAVAEVRSQSLPGGPFFGLIAQAKGEANRGLRLNSFSEKTNFM